MTQKGRLFKGALILASSNLLVKLIGVAYTIPLARLIGPEGMGLYSSAYQIYMWLFVLSTTGFPLAVSKMISENIAISREHEANKVFIVSFVLMLLAGLISSLALFFGANLIVNLIGAPKAYHCVLVISPCLFFVSIMSALRGYFQGLQDMMPTALSQLVEIIIKVGCGLGLAYIFWDKGIEWVSAGAVAGVSIGALFGCLFISFIYLFKGKKRIKNVNKEYSSVNSTKNIIIKLISIALPITLGASIFSISGLIDLGMIIRRLRGIGFSQEYALKLYGYLTGYAYKIYTFPATIVIALAISIVPILSSIYAKKNMLKVKKLVGISLKWALLFAIPSAVGIGVLAKQVLSLLFRDTEAQRLLEILSLAIVFVTIVQVSNAILQSIGRVMMPVKNLMLGVVIKISVNYLLVGIPSINICGAAIGTIVCYASITILNLWDIYRCLNIKYDFKQLFLKPIFAASIMGIFINYMYYNLYYYFGNCFSTLISILLGMMCYGLIVVLIGGINKEDLEMLPIRGKMYNFLLQINLIK